MMYNNTTRIPDQEPIQNIPENRFRSALEFALSLGIHQREGRSFRCDCPNCLRPTLRVSPGRDGEIKTYCFYCGGSALRKALAGRGLVETLPTGYEIDHAKVKQAWNRWWDPARPLLGSPAEIYLRGRGIDVRLLRPSILFNIRFHPQVWHVGRASCLSAMVAKSHAANGDSRAVHATFLTDKGAKANVLPPKQTFGSTGGAAIYFGPSKDEIAAGEKLGTVEWVIGEGVETVLSYMAIKRRQGACGERGPCGICALSAKGLQYLELPSFVRQVIIAADNDADGLGQKVANAAIWRWSIQKRLVRLAVPRRSGEDWNDVLARMAP